MASNIIPSNIDITYPIAGQDNDTQGFRTNFTNIRNNFTQAAKEITDLQGNVATLTADTYSNANVAAYLPTYTGAITAANVTLASALYLANISTAQRNTLTPTNGMLIYNHTFNKFQGYGNGAWGNITLS